MHRRRDASVDTEVDVVAACVAAWYTAERLDPPSPWQFAASGTATMVAGLQSRHSGTCQIALTGPGCTWHCPDECLVPKRVVPSRTCAMRIGGVCNLQLACSMSISCRGMISRRLAGWVTQSKHHFCMGGTSC